jgi:imidazolonepropionase-like amidohydrolase
VLQPDTILDPASRSHLTGHWLLLDGSKISAIGRGDPPAGVEVVRLAGKTVMPGLVDSHGHLAFRYGHGSLRDQLNAGRSAQRDLATANMRSRLAQGITLMRDLSERDFLDVEVARARDAGRLAGPRVVCATRGIKAPEGHGFCGTPFKGEAAIRQAVQENRAAGAQFLKLYVTGSLYGTPETLGHAYLSLAEVRAATQEAHRLGMPVSAHAFAGAGIEVALAAGVDCIEHGMFPDDDQIVRMASQGTWLSTTYAYAIGEQAPAPVPEGLWDRAAERLGKMLKAGIAIAAGTDEGSGGIAHEARALLSLGVPPWTVLEAITHAGARLCGLGDQVGALRPGYDADLVVLEGDPLEDLNSLTRVHAVYQAGVAFSQTLR